MLKRGLLIMFIFLINGCVGTVRMAQDSNTEDLNQPVVTKGEQSQPRK